MTPEQRKHFEYVRDVIHGDQCPSCGGFCKKSGCERKIERVAECPKCERYKQSASMWRNKAYEFSGKPLPWKPDELWVGLTNGEIAEAVKLMERGNFMVAIQNIEARLKELNT